MVDEKHHLWVLGAVWVLLYLLGNNLLTVTEPVECNYAETAREMLQYSDYFSPRILGNFWFDKPILYYWELAASFAVFGLNNFAARFPAALMVAAAMALLYFWGRRLYGSRVALVAALLFATSLETWYVGHAIITDMTLLVTVSLTLIMFYRGYTEKRNSFFYYAFAAAAFAVLDKGPIGLCLPGLIILIFLVWQKDWRVLLAKEIFLGFILFLAVASIWYVPMFMLHGRDFVDVFLGVHNVMRATVSEHPSDNVWYYYIGIFLAGFFPWSLVAVPAAVQKWRKGWRLKLTVETKFLLVWAVTVFLVFQCFATKYVTYTFPYMFPVVLLMARFFCHTGKKFFYGAAVMSMVYVSVLFLVAVPRMENHSSYQMAMAARSYLDKGVEVYCFQRSGSVISFSYYTGAYTWDLVEKQDITEDRKLDWSVTDIVPKKDILSVDHNKPLLIISTEQGIKKLQERWPGKWHKLADGYRQQLYYHEAEERGI